MANLLALVIGYALSSFFLKLFTTIGIGIFTYTGLLVLINKIDTKEYFNFEIRKYNRKNT